MVGHDEQLDEKPASGGGKTHQAFLLTLWYRKTGASETSFVTLQPSHSSEAKQFETLTDVFDFLNSLSVAEPTSVIEHPLGSQSTNVLLGGKK